MFRTGCIVSVSSYTLVHEVCVHMPAFPVQIVHANVLLKGASRLASSHLEIFVSLFQPATVVSKKFKTAV